MLYEVCYNNNGVLLFKWYAEHFHSNLMKVNYLKKANTLKNFT